MSKNIKNESSLLEQLLDVRKMVPNRGNYSVPRFSHPANWTEDGVDHINVSSISKTTLGKLLNTRNSTYFKHPILGNFRTLDNLSAFLRMNNYNDGVRVMDNFRKLRDYVQEIGGWRKETVNYRALMLHAAYLRILQLPELMKMVMENKLPYDSYMETEGSGVRTRYEPAMFLCRGYEIIADALAARKSLDISPFLDKQPPAASFDLYADLLNELAVNYEGNAGEIITAFEEKCWKRFDEMMQEKAAVEQAEKERRERKAEARRAKLKRQRERQRERAAAKAIPQAAEIAAEVIAANEAFKKEAESVHDLTSGVVVAAKVEQPDTATAGSGTWPAILAEKCGADGAVLYTGTGGAGGEATVTSEAPVEETLALQEELQEVNDRMQAY